MRPHFSGFSLIQTVRSHMSAKLHLAIFFVCCAFGIASMASASFYTDDFDTNTSASWTTNASTGNNAATFSYDYSAVGIPSAPHSVGGSTKGLKLEANYNGRPAAAAFTGLSVSPTGQNFTGNYVLHADVWLNFLG